MKRKITLADKLLLVLFFPGLTIYDRAVLQCLIWRQGSHEKTWPGIRTIARDLDFSPTTVQLCINKLVRIGYLRRRLVRVGRSFNNEYIVHLVHVPANGTSAYRQTLQNFKQLTRTDPVFEEPVGQKAAASRETLGEKARRKLRQDDISRREQLKPAKEQSKEQETTNPPDKEVNHGTK